MNEDDHISRPAQTTAAAASQRDAAGRHRTENAPAQ